MAHTDPVTVWKALHEGNERFVAGAPEHPHQSATRRAELVSGQQPVAVVFGCSDSRAAAELIFDQGLGDLFVIRTAGHVLDSAALGSIEFGVGVLGVALVVVMGHRGCGAVKAARSALDDGEIPGGYVRDLVERVATSILAGRRDGLTSTDDFEDRHVSETAAQLMARSAMIAERVAAGTLAIAGVTYQLADGRAVLCERIGDVGGWLGPGGH
jgi:carbonic anhydrase